jgi:hypothetical protein
MVAAFLNALMTAPMLVLTNWLMLVGIATGISALFTFIDVTTIRKWLPASFQPWAQTIFDSLTWASLFEVV